jgi:hypothetical protein
MDIKQIKKQLIQFDWCKVSDLAVIIEELHQRENLPNNVKEILERCKSVSIIPSVMANALLVEYESQPNFSVEVKA